MISTRSIFNESSYPGEYIPKHQILQALSEGVFKEDKSSYDPKITVSDSEENYKVEFTVPGIKREDLLVTINERGNLCILSMGYKLDKNKDDSNTESKPNIDILLKEIPLPDYVDSGFTSAACHAGTLTIFFKKADYPVQKRPSTIVVY